MRAAVLLAGILFLGVTSMAGAQVVYKWVDDVGVTNFGTQPPYGVDAERTTTRIHSTNRQAVQARVDTSAERNAALVTRLQQENEQTAERKAEAKKDREIRAENCAKARKQVTDYYDARRLYRPLANGERDYLSDDELTEARENAENLASEWCD